MGFAKSWTGSSGGTSEPHGTLLSSHAARATNTSPATRPATILCSSRREGEQWGSSEWEDWYSSGWSQWGGSSGSGRQSTWRWRYKRIRHGFACADETPTVLPSVVFLFGCFVKGRTRRGGVKNSIGQFGGLTSIASAVCGCSSVKCASSALGRFVVSFWAPNR